MSGANPAPTLAGFEGFITNVMGIEVGGPYLPSNSTTIPFCLALAMTIVNPDLAGIGSALPGLPPINMYTEAVYNLAGDNLINFAADQPNQTFFTALRTGFNSTGFAAGVVATASDVSTGDSLAVPDALKQLTISNLQNSKTPWGLRYLAIAQAMGPLWGMT